jgi:hypothetical protein
MTRLLAVTKGLMDPALTVGGVLLLTASFSLASCQGGPKDGSSAPWKVPANWKPMEPPRAGLRCWYSHATGDVVAYCEPDPSATHGAGQ